MSLRLLRRKITVQRVTAKGTANTVVEGTLVIPEGMPVISRALEVNCRPVVTKVESMEDRAFIEGFIACELLYSSLSQPRHSPSPSSVDEGENVSENLAKERLCKASWKKGLSFAYLLEVPQATETDQIEVSCQVKETHFFTRNDETSIDLDVMLELAGRVNKTEEKEITTGVSGDEVGGVFEEIKIKSVLSSVSASQIVSAVLPWGGRSSPENIIEVDAKATEVRVQSDGENITVSGTLSYSALYEGPEGVGVQYARWPNAKDFEIGLVIEGLDDRANLKARVDVDVLSWRIERTEEGEQLIVETEVTATVSEVKRQAVPCLAEITSAKEIALRSEELSVYEWVGEQEIRKEYTIILELPKDALPVERLLRGKSSINGEEAYLLEDKVAIEGQINIGLLYLGRNEGTQVASVTWPQVMTFDLEIPIRGIEPEMDRQVKVEVEHIELDLINRETIEAKILLKAEAEVGRMKTVYPVIEAVEVPQDTIEATFVYVLIQKGDSLWKLSKLYRTTIPSILALNQGIKEDETLKEGEKVCIIPGNV
jgi:LysM repeat protein